MSLKYNTCLHHSVWKYQAKTQPKILNTKHVFTMCFFKSEIHDPHLQAGFPLIARLS